MTEIFVPVAQHISKRPEYLADFVPTPDSKSAQMAIVEGGRHDDWRGHSYGLVDIKIDPNCTVLRLGPYHLNLIARISPNSTEIFPLPLVGTKQEADPARPGFRYTTLITNDGRIYFDTSLIRSGSDNSNRLPDFLEDLACKIENENSESASRIREVISKIELAFNINPVRT